MSKTYNDFRNFDERIDWCNKKTIDWKKDKPMSLAWLSDEKKYDHFDAYEKASTLVPLKQSIASACHILHPYNDHNVTWGSGFERYVTDFMRNPVEIYLSGGILTSKNIRFGFRTDVVFGGALHEISHVHYTKLWNKVIDRKDPLFKDLVNILEDERIERLMRQDLIGFGRYLDALDQSFNDQIYLAETERGKQKPMDNFARKMSIVFKYVRMPNDLTPDDLAYNDEITGDNIVNTLHDIVKDKDLLEEETVLAYADAIISRLFRSNDEQEKETENHGEGQGQGPMDMDELKEQIKQGIKQQMQKQMKQEIAEQMKEKMEQDLKDQFAEQIKKDSKDENGDPTVSDEDAEKQAQEKVDELKEEIEKESKKQAQQKVNAQEMHIDEKADEQAQASMEVIVAIQENSKHETTGIDETVAEEIENIEKRDKIEINVKDKESRVGEYTMSIASAKTNTSKYKLLKGEVSKYAQILKRQMTFRDSVFKREITNRKEGKINRRKLWTVNTKDPRPFKTVSEKKANKVDLAILMDMSGSMGRGSGSPMWNCQKVATLFAEAFKTTQTVNLWIYGHTTTGSLNGEKISLLKYYSNRNKKLKPETLGYVPLQRNNIDGFAIEQVGELLKKNGTGSKQVVIVVSDGAPAGSRYSGQGGIDHVRKVTKKLKAKLHQTVIQVAIDNDVPSEEMFDHHVKFTNMSTLVKDMTSLVKKIIR